MKASLLREKNIRGWELLFRPIELAGVLGQLCDETPVPCRRGKLPPPRPKGFCRTGVQVRPPQQIIKFKGR